MSTNAPKDIWGGRQIYPEFNTRDATLKIHDRIRQTQNECKEAEYQQRVWAKVYIRSLRLFLMN